MTGSGGLPALVPVHQHPQGAGGGDLLAFHEIRRQVLGNLVAAASMMGNALKGDGASLTLQIKGGGPLGTVLAVSDSQGRVRGYVQPSQ